MESYYIVSIEVALPLKAPKLYHFTVSSFDLGKSSKEEVLQFIHAYIEDIPGEKKLKSVIQISAEEYKRFFTNTLSDWSLRED